MERLNCVAAEGYPFQTQEMAASRWITLLRHQRVKANGTSSIVLEQEVHTDQKDISSAKVTVKQS